MLSRISILAALSQLAWGQVQAPPIPHPVPTPYPGMAELQSEINLIRDIYNLPQLTSTIELDCASYRHARDLAYTNRCEHQGSDGSSFQRRAMDCGTVAQAQLIGCGFETAKGVVSNWMKDRRAARIILAEDNLAIGTAMIRDKWVVVFRKIRE